MTNSIQNSKRLISCPQQKKNVDFVVVREWGPLNCLVQHVEAKALCPRNKFNCEWTYLSGQTEH